MANKQLKDLTQRDETICITYDMRDTKIEVSVLIDVDEDNAVEAINELMEREPRLAAIIMKCADNHISNLFNLKFI